MTEFVCDVAVIGAGTAGLAAERTARRAGAKTLLIDDGFTGSTCATVGCMPSKLLITAAAAAHGVRTAGTFGIDVAPPRVDGVAVLARVRTQRDAFVSSMLTSIEKLPEEIKVNARATFSGADTLALSNGDTVRAKAIVIATGSHPQVPEPFAALGDLVLTNETIFDLADLPRSLAVIGAGALGIELAQAMARLGVEVAVFDKGDTLAGLKDAMVADALHTILARDMDVHLGVDTTPSREGEQAVLRWTGASAGMRAFDKVLVAAGRPPSLDGLSLDKTGLDLDDHGVPLFDRTTMQCGRSAIFLAGDADADAPVLHEASSEGAIAGRNAASFPDVHHSERSVAFSITFTDPPVAVVGKPSQEDSVIGVSPYDDQGRAKIMAQAEGLVRLYASRPDGRLTGAAMVGPGMDHIGHLLAWAIGRGETATSLLDLPFYHPTLEEGLKAGLREICHTVHAPIPDDQDEGSPAGG
ncbi:MULTISPECIES: dihydrolipoyl dehydrogenase [unclassified Sphingomonas]|uniref:dihydrolipoyl dehydrogenase n=1 Tax=unclassified Sphingomonas TaxID=196159 RepID=UPI00226A1A1E|nr:MULTISPECIES: dihydrolipoyl dehydrogenase [unclassified Sphingomonas]